jgi:hypothetical protein
MIPAGETGVVGRNHNRRMRGMAISIPHAKRKYRNNADNLFSLTPTSSEEVLEKIVYG